MLLLAFLFLATAPHLVRSEMTWTRCDSASTPIEADDVQLTPDPPVIGSPATFVIQGKAGEQQVGVNPVKS